MDDQADVQARAAGIVAAMTLAEKAALCVGRDFWRTTGVSRLGVPSIVMTDGPHGVRLQQGDTSQAGIADAVPATCFPTASALASTWDTGLVAEVAGAIADEARSLGVDVVLGPGANASGRRCAGGTSSTTPRIPC